MARDDSERRELRDDADLLRDIESLKYARKRDLERLDRTQGKQAALLVALTFLGALVVVTLVRKGVVSWSDLWNIGETVADG